jgi:hypothetical protein
MGAKVSDEWTVPLCFLHHRALHDSGAEETWWQVHGTDPLAEAKRLWQQRRNGVDEGTDTKPNGGHPMESGEQVSAATSTEEEPVAITAE